MSMITGRRRQNRHRRTAQPIRAPSCRCPWSTSGRSRQAVRSTSRKSSMSAGNLNGEKPASTRV